MWEKTLGITEAIRSVTRSEHCPHSPPDVLDARLHRSAFPTQPRQPEPRRRRDGRNFAVLRWHSASRGYVRETPYKPYNDAFLRLSDPTFVLHQPYMVGLIEPYIFIKKHIYKSKT